jgi:hypothetical protein
MFQGLSMSNPVNIRVDAGCIVAEGVRYSPELSQAIAIQVLRPEVAAAVGLAVEAFGCQASAEELATLAQKRAEANTPT